MSAWITNLNEITSMISSNLFQVIRLLNCWVLLSPGRVQGAIPVAAYWLGEQIVGAWMGNGKGELEERSTVNAGWEAGYDKEVPDVVGRLGSGIMVGRRRSMLRLERWMSITVGKA
jgi:hypothetical protein